MILPIYTYGQPVLRKEAEDIVKGAGKQVEKTIPNSRHSLPTCLKLSLRPMGWGWQLLR